MNDSQEETVRSKLVLRMVEPEELRPRMVTCSVMNLLALSAVVLVLGAALVPNFVRARSRGCLTACKSNLKNIGTAYEMYSTDNHGQYTPKLEMLTPKYLKQLPKCPQSNRMTYRSYTGQGPNNNPGFQDYYYVECHGASHTAVSVTGNYPAYDSISGLIERP